MRLSYSYRVLGFVGLAVLLSAAFGCTDSYKARATVKGHIKFFDKHLTAGTVVFAAADGRTGSANIDFDGNYEMRDAPIGDVTITVTVPKPPNPRTVANMPKPPAGVSGMPAGMVPENAENPASGVAGTGGIDPSKIVQIPAKYSKPETSGLKWTVPKGGDTYNITLSP